jgi:hypothetical protein
MPLARRIREAAPYPRGYGYAYHDAARWAVCYPVPLNLLVGLARRAYARARAGVSDPAAAAYAAGYLAGQGTWRPLVADDVRGLVLRFIAAQQAALHAQWAGHAPDGWIHDFVAEECVRLRGAAVGSGPRPAARAHGVLYTDRKHTEEGSH